MSTSIIAEGCYPVTPNNNQDLPSAAFGIYVTGAGDVAFVGANGVKNTVTLAANSTFPCRMKRILSTGTTATGIHAFVAS